MHSIRAAKGAVLLVANDCLVLPAFSRDAAGADVARDRRWDTFRRVVIAGEHSLQHGERGL